MSIDHQTLFPANYDVELLEELYPTYEPRFFYPGAHTDGGANGPTFRVAPAARAPWLGTFAFRHRGAGSSGVFTTPDPDVVCIAAAGAVYLVHADKPEWWSQLDLEPVRQIIQVPGAGVIVFVGDIMIEAHDRQGRVWITPRLGFDRLSRIVVTGETLTGIGSDPTMPGGGVPFTVDLRTGASSGGSSPERYTHTPVKPRSS